DLDGLENDYYLNQKQSEILGDGTITVANDNTGIIPKVMIQEKIAHNKGDLFTQTRINALVKNGQGSIELPQKSIYHKNAYTPIEKALPTGVEIGEALTSVYALKYLPRMVRNLAKFLDNYMSV